MFAGTYTKLLKQLVGSLDELIEDKLESTGRDLITNLILAIPIGPGFAAAQRFAEAIESGGAREYERARGQWLNAIKPSFIDPGTGSGLSRKVLDAFKNASEKAIKESSRPEAGHWKWSRSRREWLNEDWRHDWRSQPRDKLGRWIPGRLKTIYVAPKLKKLRSARRRFVRKIVKERMRGD